MYYLWKAVVVVLVLLSNHVVMPRNIATAQTRNAQASSQSTEHKRMLQGPMLPSQRRTVVTRPSAYGINQRGNRITNNRNVPAVATPIPKNTTTKTPTRTAAPIGAADDGIPTNTPTKTAVPAYPWGVFTEISAGYGHSCALTSVGSAYCWGENTLGQLGSGSTISIYFPVPVIVPAGVTTFTEISAGDTHTCMLTSTGAAYCTGSSRYGQLGNGITDISTISNIPVTVSMPTGVTTFASISAGDKHTCALTNAGVAYCWVAIIAGN